MDSATSNESTERPDAAKGIKASEALETTKEPKTTPENASAETPMPLAELMGEPAPLEQILAAQNEWRWRAARSIKKRRGAWMAAGSVFALAGLAAAAPLRDANAIKALLFWGAAAVAAGGLFVHLGFESKRWASPDFIDAASRKEMAGALAELSDGPAFAKAVWAQGRGFTQREFAQAKAACEALLRRRAFEARQAQEAADAAAQEAALAAEAEAEKEGREELVAREKSEREREQIDFAEKSRGGSSQA